MLGFSLPKSLWVPGKFKIHCPKLKCFL
jgi:hypothetical protein